MPGSKCPPGMVQAWAGRVWKLPEPVPTKEQRSCCRARRDELGRLPVGFCSPECEGRSARDAALRSLD